MSFNLPVTMPLFSMRMLRWAMRVSVAAENEVPNYV